MKEEDIRKREVFNQYLELAEKDAQNILANYTEFLTINCLACGSDKLNPQFNKSGFNYVLCSNCKTLFVNPRPPIKRLNNFYSNSISANFWVEKFFKPMVESRREKIFKPRAEFIRDKFIDNPAKTVGDIGAGFGLFLEELSKFWPNSKMVAIEVSSDMVKICKNKGLEVISLPVENVEGWNGRFDLLTAFELFEHLHSPEIMLDKVWDLLAPGGYFLLTTLNGQGFDIQILWEKSKSIAPPQHLNFFNPNSLSILLKSKGFEIKEVSTPGQLDWNIVEGMYREEKIDIGRFWKLVAENTNVNAKNNIQKWISENNLSSHMKILCQKPV